MKKTIILVVIAVILVTGVVGGIYYKKSHAEKKTNVTTVAITDPNVVEFTSKEGQTALEVLKANAEVNYTNSSSGALVNEVNGIKNSDTKFWIYSVNGVDGTVAADKYICKNGDVVKWEYKGF